MIRIYISAFRRQYESAGQITKFNFLLLIIEIYIYIKQNTQLNTDNNKCEFEKSNKFIKNEST